MALPLLFLSAPWPYSAFAHNPPKSSKLLLTIKVMVGMTEAGLRLRTTQSTNLKDPVPRTLERRSSPHFPEHQAK